MERGCISSILAHPGRHALFFCRATVTRMPAVFAGPEVTASGIKAQWMVALSTTFARSRGR